MNIFRIIRSKSQYKVIFGFVFVSLFVFVISHISLRTIHEIDDGYRHISIKSTPLLHYLEEMKFSCIRLVSSASEFGYLVAELNNKKDRPQLQHENELIQQSCTSCHDAFLRFEEEVKESFPDALAHLNELRTGGIVLYTSAIKFIDVKKRGITGPVALEKKEEMEKGEMEFLDAVQGVIDHTNDRLTSEKSILASLLSSSYSNILFLSGLTLLISILIGLMISRSMEEENKLNKLASEKAIQSSHQLELILDVAGDGIISLDSDGRHSFVNPQTCSILGYSYEELIGNRSHGIFHHSYQDGTKYPDNQCPIYETLHDGKEHYGEEFFWRKDGSGFPVRYSSLPVFENGTIKGAVVTFRDITQQKELEKLRNSLYEISEAVNQTPGIDSLYKRIHEIVKQLMHADNFYIALYDEESDLISFPYFIDEVDEAGPPVKPGKGCTEYVLRTGDPVIIGIELSDELNRRGEVDIVGVPSEVWLGVPLKINNKTIGVMVVQDYHNEKVYSEKEKQILVFVSEQVASAIEKKRTDEKLKKFTDELVQLNAEKDKFFSIIAHDLRSPFNTIISFSELLQEQIDELNRDAIEKFAGHIKQSSVRAMDLLMNLMEWSRAQTGRMNYTPEIFNLSDMICSAFPLLNDMAKQKSIRITLDVDSVDHVFADKEMIATVLRNLISNAIKFTSREGKISISSNVHDGQVTVSVRDDGVGIPADNISKLFRIDEGYSTSGTQNEQGTGLGLILCKEFIEKNSGRIWVESEENKGSVFYFTLPMNERRT